MVFGLIQTIRTRSLGRAVSIATLKRFGLMPGLAVYLVVAFVSAALAASDSPLVNASYPLATGDSLGITVFGEPELSGDFEVDSLGLISLPLIGRVRAAGLDTGELEVVIVEKLKDGYLNHPMVTVEVRAYRPFYILGGVKSPGRYPYVLGMTVINAIALSGGFYATELDDLRMRLEVTRESENLNLLQGDYRIAIIREARLLAERDGLEEIAFPQEVLQNRNDPKVIEQINGEMRIFTTRRESLADEIEIFTINVLNFGEEISALKAQIISSAEQIKLLSTEIEGLESLMAKGYTTIPRLLALKRTSAERKAERHGQQASLARARQNIGRAELQIIKLSKDQHSDVVAQLQGVQNNISKLEKQQGATTNLLRENIAAATRAGTRLRDQTGGRIVITRNTTNGLRDLEAEEHTPVFPGDVIRIPGSLSSPVNLDSHVSRSGRYDSLGSIEYIESDLPKGSLKSFDSPSGNNDALDAMNGVTSLPPKRKPAAGGID
jgi:protein involved in polysaccharide export with SLBB domain